MKCPDCGSSDVYIVDTRKKVEDRVNRRRACMSCDYRWNTTEVRAEELAQLQIAAQELTTLQAMVRRCV